MIPLLGKQVRSCQEQPFVFSVQKKYVKFVLPVVSVKWSFMEMKNNGKSSLREKCPNTELFLDTFHAEH